MSQQKLFKLEEVLAYVPVKIKEPGDRKQFEKDCKELRYYDLCAKYNASWSTVKLWKKKYGLTNGKKQDREITWNVMQGGKMKDCWICTSHKPDQFGYPQGNGSKGRRLIARVMWSRKHGVWPKMAHCLHSCDNPLCINPDHVSPGTQQENQIQMAERDRSAWGDRCGARKINSIQARAIYDLKDSGRSIRDVGKEFGVSGANVWQIWKGNTWKRDIEGVENSSVFLTTGEKVIPERRGK